MKSQLRSYSRTETVASRSPIRSRKLEFLTYLGFSSCKQKIHASARGNNLRLSFDLALLIARRVSTRRGSERGRMRRSSRDAARLTRRSRIPRRSQVFIESPAGSAKSGRRAAAAARERRRGGGTGSAMMITGAPHYKIRVDDSSKWTYVAPSPAWPLSTDRPIDRPTKRPTRQHCTATY